MHVALHEIVITLVAWQAEILEIGKCAGAVPIVVSQSGKEAVLAGAATKTATIGADEVGVIATDIFVDRIRCANWVVVVASGQNEVHLPTLDEFRNALRTETAAVVPEHCEADEFGRVRFTE